ncbi:MAG: hypothetical protein M0Q12_07100 [Synergistaceae bacterium]|jgi:hypothetical protein|nr:hypothetical protein [Synergistaceae bacterium]
MTRRLYKDKKDYENSVILDDREFLLNRVLSKCLICEHFKEWDFFCVAFPKGIPDEYLSGEKAHTAKDSRQVGDTVFTERI